MNLSHEPPDWFVNAQFVESVTDVLDEGVAGDNRLAPRSVFNQRIGRSRRFS